MVVSFSEYGLIMWCGICELLLVARGTLGGVLRYQFGMNFCFIVFLFVLILMSFNFFLRELYLYSERESDDV